MEISCHDIIETLNVLVNDRSSLDSYTFDLIAPQKLTSEITLLPLLSHKRFLHDLRISKVKQICVLIVEFEYASDIRSAMVFAEDGQVLSSSSWTIVSLMRRPGLSDIHPNRGNRSEQIISTMI